jgi:sugar (pentulose or hexulose) kinase
VQDATVVAAGGPLENVPLWGRMVSDTLGRSVQLVDALEVAVLICESLTGVVPTVGVKREIVPEKEAHAAYAKALARNNELYDQMYAKL